MSPGKNFTEEDKKALIDFLNYVAEHATFEMKTKDVLSYFKLLRVMQTSILPKVEKHILEVVKVVEPEKEEVEIK